MIVFAGNASLEGEGVGGNRGDCGVVEIGWEGGRGEGWRLRWSHRGQMVKSSLERPRQGGGGLIRVNLLCI